MRTALATSLFALIIAAAGAATAQTKAPDSASATAAPLDDAHAFGRRESIHQISLSPDGTRYAAIMATTGTGKMVIVGPIDGSTKPTVVVTSSGKPEDLNWCRWANDQRLVCNLSTSDGKGVQRIGFTRLVAINAAGGGLKMLSADPGSNATGLMQDGGTIIDWYGDPDGKSVLMTREFVEEASIGHIASQPPGLAVARVDPMTARATVIERARGEASEYIADGNGTVRIMGQRDHDGSGYLKSSVHYFYRKPGEREWATLSVVKEGGGFNPYAVDSKLNVAYGFDEQDGRSALFKVTLDGTGKKELVFARPDVDVDELISIGRHRRVVGVGYATEKRHTFFFDPELAKLQTSLAKALPNLPLVSFVDASADEKRLLLWLGSDADPGYFAVFDKQTRHLDQILNVRPELAGRPLASVTPITFTATDGTVVPGYLTLPPGGRSKVIGAIVMPHGGPAARDEWGFDWFPQFFAARGYAVLQPNYRGSTGYGDAWYAKNGFKSWRLAIGDVNDAGRWLVKQGYTSADHLAIVGWSYGGYAALQSQVLDANLFKAIVAVAPVTDFDMAREEARDFDNFTIVDQEIGQGPHIREGSPARNVAAFQSPVLVFHGDNDSNVGIAESRVMASRLRSAGKSVELVEFKGLDHQLDDSDARAQMLAKMDAFLRTTLKLPPS